MSSAKSELASISETQPGDSSFEDVQYHLYVLEKVKRGVERAESEGTRSNAETKQRAGKWLDD